MTVGETIRTRFPLSLAKRYEAVLLEGEPQLRAIRLIELYESSVRHLALVGLAAYRHLDLSDEPVEEARDGLAQPGLHWQQSFEQAFVSGLAIAGNKLLVSLTSTDLLIIPSWLLDTPQSEVPSHLDPLINLTMLTLKPSE